MSNLFLPTIFLLSISAFGFYSIIGLTERNGWGPMLRASLEDEPVLPDTGKPLRTHYTGVAALDALLTTLVRVFYSGAVGESPALSVFTLYFAGQILPSHALLVLEGLRAGNKGTTLYFPAIWGIAYQCIPFGVSLPLYCVVHLRRSHLARISKSATAQTMLELLSMDPVKLSTVTGAMILGFVATTALPTLPASLISSQSRQAFLALWQIFPLCVSLSHRALEFTARVLGLAPTCSRDASMGIMLARKAYRQILAISTVVHIGIIALVVTPHLQQALFGLTMEPVTFRSVFRPMSAFSPPHIEALTEGTQALLQYDMYCGCTAAFVWVITLSYMVAGSSTGAAVKTGAKLLLRSFLAGPGSAVLWAFWDRDEEVWASVGAAKKAA